MHAGGVDSWDIRRIEEDQAVCVADAGAPWERVFRSGRISAQSGCQFRRAPHWPQKAASGAQSVPQVVQ